MSGLFRRDRDCERKGSRRGRLEGGRKKKKEKEREKKMEKKGTPFFCWQIKLSTEWRKKISLKSYLKSKFLPCCEEELVSFVFNECTGHFPSDY